MAKQIRLGLIIGRFQPLHEGHLYLIEKVFKENDQIIIGIGSAQTQWPLKVAERRQRLEEALRMSGFPAKQYRIVELEDINNMDLWPTYVLQQCGITDQTTNTLYRGEPLPELCAKDFERRGVRIKIIPRITFTHIARDGSSHKVSSATEIRQIERSNY